MEPDNADETVNQLAESARGWHRIQLAVLGFVGICGVLWANGQPSGPGWLQWLAGGLAVLALALAGLAIYLVGRVAHPFPVPASAGPPAVAAGSRRLRTGIRLTYLAVALLAVASLSAWWPKPADASTVEASDTAGRSWCGELAEAPPGTLQIDTADGPVTLPVRQLAELRPVDAC